ncbi:AAA family ATPase [Citrobacter youngae]|nr:AAA family ATPase [Citrobacter youngae]
MILKYAFIKKYLNIENLEINLDSRYDFNIDRDTLILTEGENSIPEDFYANNLNLSCLVGKNGSGKTSIMSFLTSIGAGEILRLNYDADYIAIFLHDSKYYVLDVCSGELSFKSGSIAIRGKKIRIPLENDSINLLQNYNSYYLSSNNTNMIKSGIISSENDFSVGNEKRYKGMHNIVEILQFIKTYPFPDQLSELCKNKKIRLVISDQWLGMLNLSYLFGSIKNKNITSRIKYIKKETANSKLFLPLLILLRIYSSNMHKKTTNEINGLREYLKNRLDVDAIISILDKNSNQQLDELLKQYICDDSILQTCIKLGELISYNDIGKNIFVDFSLIPDDLNVLYMILNISLENQILAEGYKYYFFPPFSTGQWKRIELSCKINNLEKKTGGAINLFIDEPDADLHPEMQTKLISWLISLVQDKDQNFNVIISTHNPIILSDFPRRRVIYVGDNVIDYKKVKTLAANIYNLYKESFLVSNAISEFVRSKIDKAVKDKNINDLIFLIDEVSEPLIVKSLTNTLEGISFGDSINSIALVTLIEKLSDKEKEFLRRKLDNEQ